METNAVDLLVVNGENAAGGFGITPSIAEELFDLGAHVITTGNHIWDKKEIFEYMTVPVDSHARGRRVLRPAGCVLAPRGHVETLVPPDGDIHAVTAAGRETAISIHVYGADIERRGTSIYRRFDGVRELTAAV